MQRVMCIWFPHWPIQRWRDRMTTAGTDQDPSRAAAADTRLERRPLLLYELQGRRGPVITACSRQARQAGVQPGMPLAEARAQLQPHVPQWGLPQIAAHDPTADRQALRRLARRFQHFSPLVGLEDAASPECLLMDLTGCAHLFGGEDALAGQIIYELYSRGLFARLATADTIGAAWAISHFGTTGHLRPSAPRPSSATGHRSAPRTRHTSQLHWTVAALLEPGRQRVVLPSLPVQALRLPGRIVSLLQELDLRTIGQLQNLPRSSLPARFGDVLLQRLDQALGDLPEVLVPERMRETIRAHWTTEHPTSDRRVLQHVLDQLAADVSAQLQERQEGVLALQAEFRCESGHPVPLHIGLAQPSQAAAHLQELMGMQLDRLTLREPVRAITLTTRQTTSWESRQRRLFDDVADEDSQRQLALLIDRLANRLGIDAVLRADLLPDLQPEFAVRYTPLVTSPAESSCAELRDPDAPEPADTTTTASTSHGSAQHSPAQRDGKQANEIEAEQLEQKTIGAEHVPPRPVLLDPTPTLVRVQVDGETGRPIAVRWRSRTLSIGRCWGPERIETGWWRAEPVERDYFHVETADGQHLWLFRRRQDGRWFVHGVFD